VRVDAPAFISFVTFIAYMATMIWFRPYTLDQVHFRRPTLAGHLDIQFIELGPDFLKGRMPVDDRTRQPHGILHGGASVALAETLGSVGAGLVIDPDKYRAVGQEINANHVRAVAEGSVFGTARPLHLGKRSHVWDIRIVNEQEKLVCVSRLTVAILEIG
jgi:1,4-dihydroxy-2-naphthoyl-CoA hydrolase